MTVWNVNLMRRQLLIKVRKILRKEPGFMVIVDTQGKQHQLSEVDFLSFEWEKIQTGSTITLILKESVMTWRIQPPRAERSVKKLVEEVQKKVSGYFFIWVCKHCGPPGYVEYEDGDDPLGIKERIVLAHKRGIKPGCEGKIRIFDHRGIEQESSELVLSSQKVASTS